MTTIALAKPFGRYQDMVRTTWLRRLRVVARGIHQALCGIGGHDFLVRREPRWIGLECSHCGHQTRGWLLSPLPEDTGRRLLTWDRRGDPRA